MEYEYGKAHRRDFGWKYEADNFIRKLTSAAKRLHYKVDIRIEPIVAFSSSTAQRWNLLDKLKGIKNAETKTTGYVVRWMFRKPSQLEVSPKGISKISRLRIERVPSQPKPERLSKNVFTDRKGERLARKHRRGWRRFIP